MYKAKLQKIVVQIKDKIFIYLVYNLVSCHNIACKTYMYRDGADIPIYSLNKLKCSVLLNVDVLSLFRQTTYSLSASIHYNTLVKYTATVIFRKV